MADEDNNALLRFLVGEDLYSKRFLRNAAILWILLAFAAATTVAATWLLSMAVFGSSGPAVRVDDGALQFRTDHHTTTLVIHGSAGWVNTGIEVETGDAVSIESAGKVNVGFPSYTSTLDHKDALCQWELKRQDFSACKAWRFLDWHERFSHEKTLLPDDVVLNELGPNWQHIVIHAKKPVDEISCECMKEYAEDLMDGSASDWRQDAWSELDKRFYQTYISGLACKNADRGLPPQSVTNATSFSEILALTDSCLKTWLLRGQLDAKFATMGFSDPTGIDASLYSQQNENYPSFPQPGKLYPSYAEDSLMLCQNHPHGLLVGYITRSPPEIVEANRCFAADNGKAFTVAKGKQGTLWLAINDASPFLDQNLGSFLVTVRVSSPWYKFWRWSILQ